jgi:peptide/nickel transport system substrate-binding protein
MKFHDGKPLTAEDVKFTYELFRREKASRLNLFTTMITDIQKTDDRTLRFTLGQPYAPFRTLSLSMLPLLPKHIWEGLPQKAGLSSIGDWPNIPPIGSGPFKFDYWRRGEELKLSRNSEHFNAPHIEGIINIPYADGQGAVLGVEKGESDLISWNVGPINAKRLAQFKHLKVVAVRTNAALGIDYNNTREPFKDVRVRQALAYAVPKSKIIREIYDGQADIGQAVIAPVNKFWHNPNVKKFDLDMKLARQLLQEAGYEWDSQGRIYRPAR